MRRPRPPSPRRAPARQPSSRPVPSDPSSIGYRPVLPVALPRGTPGEHWGPMGGLPISGAHGRVTDLWHVLEHPRVCAADRSARAGPARQRTGLTPTGRGEERVSRSGLEDLAVQVEQPRDVLGVRSAHPALRADAPLATPEGGVDVLDLAGGGALGLV